MVRTRQSGEAENDSPSRFLALEEKGSRKSRYRVADGEDDSDHSGIVYKDEDRNMFEDKVVESRLRPRVGPSRAYNYVYEDSSDDDLVSSRRRRSRVVNEDVFTSHRRRRRESRKHSSDEEEEDDRKIWRSSRRRTGNLQKIEQHDDEVNGGHASEDDDEEDDFNNSALVRRSKRLREKPTRYRTKSDIEQTRDKERGDSADSSHMGKRRRLGDVGQDSNEEYDDMYSRVKRARHKKSETDTQEQSASNSGASNDDDEDEDKNDSENETEQRRSYSLREQRRMPQRYVAPIEESRRKPKVQSLFRETPPRRVKKHTYRSPAHRSNSRTRKRHAFHGSSSSTSSDSDTGGETTDEQRFSRRKAKSMAKARSRILPLNFTKDTVPASSVLKDRVRAGASLADVDPMEIDRSVTFESVGGLQKHIRTLKEMIVFPLLYPEFYERFKVAPSRGVLFYGPPGTGKTLVARALANECSRGEQRVAFFMRKGADCLSKWVGEAERQLRLLFDKAYEMRPSIIFFDEIDGLAPVRSSRQDQIHSSIVSTLLALMDGIDSRGEIVVIGATNRIDAIDPALRRPGRFDREFHFPLPNVQDRKKILKIHTKHWDPSLRPEFISELAEKCAGYCGADIKCLVTEATQNALRRYYPQIYTTSDKLQLDVSSITLTARDFAHALTTIIPAAQRAAPNPASALEISVRPLLQRALVRLQSTLSSKFPFAKLESRPTTPGGLTEEKPAVEIELASDEDEDLPSIFTTPAKGHRPSTSCTLVTAANTFLGFSASSSSFPTLFRPRLLVSGVAGQGQTVHLAPAALHLVEHLPVHTLSSSTLFAASAKMPEEACATVFHEAKRTAPSVIYMPYVNELWGVVSDSLRVTFLTLVRGMNPSTPILIFATSETPYNELDFQLKALFSMAGGEVVEVAGPTAEDRRQYFADLILNQTIRPPPTRKQAGSELATSGIVRFFPEWKPAPKKFRQDQLLNQSQVEVCSSITMRQTAVSLGNRDSHSFSGAVGNLTSILGSMANSCRSGGTGSFVSSGRSVTSSVNGSQQHIFESCNQRVQIDTLMPPPPLPLPPSPQRQMSSNFKTRVSKEKASFYITPVPSTSKSPGRPRSPPVRKSALELKSSPKSKVRGNPKNYHSINARSLTALSSGVQKTPKKKIKPAAFLGAVLCWKKPEAKSKPRSSKTKRGCSRAFNKPRSQTAKTGHGRARNFNQSAAYDVIPSQQFVTIRERRYPSRKAAFRKVYPYQGFNCRVRRKTIRKKVASGAQSIQVAAMRVLKSLPKAPPPEARELTGQEMKKLAEQEEDTIRELRIFLRDILSKLGREKKFSIFAKPVDIDEVPDYYEIIKKPMDLSTIMAKIDLHQYTTASAFMDDIFLVCSNALEYNPDRGPTDRAIRHRACALRDTAQALFKAELDPEFERICQEITQSRKRRGVDSSTLAPAFYHTRPAGLAQESSSLSALPSSSKDASSISTVPHPDACRFSRRVRGISADKTLSLEVVEKSAQIEKSLLGKKITAGEDMLSIADDTQSSDVNTGVEKDSKVDAALQNDCVETDPQASECNCNNSTNSLIVSLCDSKRTSKTSCDGRHSSASTLKKINQRKKCPWLTTKRRKRNNSTCGGRPKGVSPGSDIEMVSGDEASDSMSARRSSSGRRDSHHSDHEVSPTSAANPENVSKTPLQCSTRRSSASAAPSGATLQGCLSGSEGSASAAQDTGPAVSTPANPTFEEPSQNKPVLATTSLSGTCDGASRPEVVRRRLEDDLTAAAATDSGLGSCVESNGDSRDSLEHNNNNSHRLTEQESQDSGAEVDGGASGGKGSTGLSGLRRTRARTQDPMQLSALKELETEMPAIQVDKEQLKHLLDLIVCETEGFTVERLQKLYSILSCAVYNSRLEYNKSSLVQEMEQLVERFCRETEVQAL